MMNRPKGILSVLERTDFDRKLSDPNNRVRSAIHARRARDRVAQMGQLPGYNYGGQVTQYGQAPALAPLYQNMLEQMQGYGAQTMYGTPQQQAAYSAATNFGLGGGSQAMQDAYGVLTGNIEDYVDPMVDVRSRARNEALKTQMQEFGGAATMAGSDAFGGRGQLMQQGMMQDARQEEQDDRARSLMDAYNLRGQEAMRLAQYGGQEQNLANQRLNMALNSANASANIPYDALARQVGITQGMGMRGPTYQGPAQQPGFLERIIGRGAEFMSAYPFMKDQMSSDGWKDRRQVGKGVKSLLQTGQLPSKGAG